MPPTLPPRPLWSVAVRELVARKGGVLLPDHADAEERPFIEGGARRAAAWINLWRIGRGRIWKQVDWTLLDNKVCDAFAHFDGVMHLVGVHSGLFVRLARTITAVLADKPFVVLVEGSPALEAAVRPALATELLDDAVCWVVMHELAHVMRGHVYHLRTAGLCSTLCEAQPDPHLNGPTGELVRFFENDADAVGIDFTIRLAEGVNVKRWRKAKRISRLRRLVVAAGLAMLAIDRSGLPLRRPGDAPNPHPFVRLLLMLDTAGASAHAELGLVLEEVTGAARDALRALARGAAILEASGTSWSTPSESLYREALGVQEEEQRRYKEMTPTWFRGRSTLLPPGEIA